MLLVQMLNGSVKNVVVSGDLLNRENARNSCTLSV